MSDVAVADNDAFCLRCGESVFLVAKGLEVKRTGLEWITFPCKRTHIWGKQAEVLIAYSKGLAPDVLAKPT